MTTSTKITVIGSRLAKRGEAFFFLGEKEECKKCNIRGTCLNLDSGKKYEVVSVRNTNLLKCALHDGGVYAVEVKNALIETYIDSKKAVVGSKVTFAPVNAPVKREADGEANNESDEMISLELFEPRGLEKGDKCLVKEVFESVKVDGKTYNRVHLILE